MVEGNADLQVGVILEQSGIGQRLETQPVAGVGRVRYQFPQENFLVAVQGVDHQLQQLFDFGLEAQCLAGGGFGHGMLSCEFFYNDVTR